MRKKYKSEYEDEKNDFIEIDYESKNEKDIKK